MKLGKAFSDSVSSEQHKVSRIPDENIRLWWLGMGRILIFATAFCVAFFILLWRLFDLTVIQGRHYRQLADGNRIRELVRHAPRGLLLDRTGKPLVANTPYYRLIKPCTDGETRDCTIALSQEEGEALGKKGLPAGSFLEIDYRRQYLYPESTAHVVGYTGEVTQEELDDEYFKLRKYLHGDRVGRTGAEAVFEEYLRGRDGHELVEVDAAGNVIRTLGRDKESSGEDVMLSLDANVQKIVYESFPKDQKGAVVVAKPTTGEILALYSSPSFDMNVFSQGLSETQYETLLKDDDQPLFDRAIGGVYPPGSTFKIVTAIAALEEKAITSSTTVEDTGVISIGPFTFPNWYFNQYGKTEGIVDIVKAIRRSNDIFFYKTGEWLGITKLAAWAQKVGLGKPLGIELGGEAGGLMPDPAWKKKHFDTQTDKAARNDEWYLGDTYHVSIGQGYLLVTPMQVNAWTNVIANGGRLCRPTIKKMTNDKWQTTNCQDLGIKKTTIDLISRGMQQACEPGGTGWPLFNFQISKLDKLVKLDQLDKTSTSSAHTTRIPVACKTGTAEFGDPKNKTHAWFTAFAPVRSIDSGNQAIKEDQNILTGEPEISVTVLVEGAGEGSSVAAPIAKKIFEEWFGR